MRLLLDTHTLLWWLTDDLSLTNRARSAIGRTANSILVSAASAWEIGTKVRLGKLPAANDLVSDLPRQLDAEGFEMLDITTDHALRAGLLPGPHKDPFDRMLIAQAQAEDLTLVSNEAVFDRYGARRIW